MKKINIITGLFLSALSLFVIVQAKMMPSEIPGSGLGPGVLPFWLGIGILILSVILVIEAVLDKKQQGKNIFTLSEAANVGVMFLALTIYVFIINLLGFGSGTLFLVIFLVRRLGRYAWWKCGIMGTTVAVVSVYLFRVLLNMNLPTGILGF
ncbi:MAG: tripartite tricarboxylate transporter TctB family protein [Bacillota bacterium]